MLFRVNSAFDAFKGADTLIQQKAVYLILNLAILGYLANKAGGMGLLPLSSGDWISLFPHTDLIERIDRF